MSLKLSFLSSRGINEPHSLAKEDKPLKTVDELFSWPPSFAGPDRKWTPSKLCLRSDSFALTKQREVIFCHDFKGGYLDDAALFGNNNASAFRFYHWHLISIFQYFSHELVTIPPACWIDVAHRNGVRVHGTFITEHWQPVGHEAFYSIFLSFEKSELAARQLHRIQNYYGFDGWLINLESKVEKEIAKIVTENICHFLKTLKSLGSEIVWYDAITVEGSLQWQNALTPRNLPFYEAADAIFLNYSWKPCHLKATRRICSTADRTRRVFVGVDCFGRGCAGGGGLNTHEALALIQKEESDGELPLSIALFAPGWTYEHANGQFAENNLHFWSLLKPYLPDFGTALPGSWHDNSFVLKENKKISLVETTFCVGQGQMMRKRSVLDNSGDWNFMALQNIWPTALCTVDYSEKGNSESIKVLASLQESFTGGSSLCIRARPNSFVSGEMFRWKIDPAIIADKCPHLEFIFKLKSYDLVVDLSYLTKFQLVLNIGGSSEVIDVLSLSKRGDNDWYVCHWSSDILTKLSRNDSPHSSSLIDVKVELNCQVGEDEVESDPWCSIYLGYFSFYFSV